MKSKSLSDWLEDLTRRARARHLTDGAWARLAGVRQETLSRLRTRTDCDFGTLLRLARAVGAEPVFVDAHELLPPALDRADEERLLTLALSRDFTREQWLAHGSAYFMAGVAVVLASHDSLDRRGLLELAETLHPGIAEPAVFNGWLGRTPLQVGRFLSLLDAGLPARAA